MSNVQCTTSPSQQTRLKGVDLLRDPIFNKGTAFTQAERIALGLSGLLPPHVSTMEEQLTRSLENLKDKPTDLQKFIYLMGLQDRNETLFYRLVVDHLEELLPIIYTPTVGLACQHYGRLFRRPRGLAITISDRGRVREILRNWPRPDVRVIVVTDGERILGLGDQGHGGMGIPIGKLSLYTACAGIHPAQCLPVMLDVGTDHEEFLQDPLYLGIRQRRVRGQEYDDFVAEFITAVGAVMPEALVQFEDFGNANAFRLLDYWKDRICTFNDDIQGTAAVTLSGLLSALRLTKRSLAEQRILFLGAGEAGIGIGNLIVSAMVDAGLGLQEARRRCWFVDSRGLVVKGRDHLAEHKLRYAHEFPYAGDLLAAINAIKPTAIIGVSTIPGSFNRQVIAAMADFNDRPIIFALSNPTSKAECSAADAYEWSEGRAIFASGSPFPPYTYQGKTMLPGQGNNAYIFPGVGLGVVASQAKRVTERMFSKAAEALAQKVLPTDLEAGRVYPSLSRIREVSAHIAAKVAQVAFDDGLASIARPGDLDELVSSNMWEPRYEVMA